jgi:hypothetical protein
MNEATREAIIKHGENLIKIFNLPVGTDPLKLCKSLRRFELALTNLNIKLCNGYIDLKEMERKSNALMVKVDKLLNNEDKRIKTFINQDPRGYALKIETRDNYDLRNKGIYLSSDWGGFGLIAPEINIKGGC